ncbi:MULTISPECIES: AbrB/MazE/SpoVT family DNA-binding domain-containing protein [unclassified Rickettsia]|jgi:AbrB family looped-hinge helix DNA binding protein|uniref:AbrB/MazE/SpoVT family DNA-binding domain-containing protein n=1 Tax=unclassified Rickettsia TaxID=114295 RepID=UPI00313343C8
MLPKKSYIDTNGKISIPIKIRKKLNLKPGDEVFIKCKEHELVVTTFQAPLEKARSIIEKYTSKSLVDILNTMRKEDASKE